MTDWNPCKPLHNNFINDERLTNCTRMILITAITGTKAKRRTVKLVKCNYGFIEKKNIGEIIAWADEPLPYR